jgi:hypothetical protein
MRQVSSGPTPNPPQPTAGRPAAIPQASTTVPRVMTAADVEALRARRSELSNQLSSASSRRKDLARELRTADGANRAGLEGRMTQLDQRIMNIENDLAETGRQLSSLPAGLVATSTTSLPMREITLNPGQLTGISIVFTIFVLAPLASGFTRMLWKRSTLPPQPAIPPETERRLERIEQAVDTIAIEVERISEGQRFVTQLMSRNAVPALVEGRAEASALKVPVERLPPGEERR